MVMLNHKALIPVGSSWTRAYSPRYYDGVAWKSRTKGATLLRTNVRADRLWLVVATGQAGCTVGAFDNGQLIKKVSLFASTASARAVLPVRTSHKWSGTLKLVVLSVNCPVVIEGVALRAY